MGIRERWIEFLRKTATGTRKTRSLLTPVGALAFFAFTSLFVLGGIIVDKVLHLPSLLPGGARLPVSIAVTALGAILAGWSAFHFLRVKGTPVPLNPPPKLVCTGPYRYVRNPMLSGVFLFLLGIGFALNSFSLVVFLVPMYVALNVWELKYIEEPELVKRLGDEYVEYRRRTPMFFPFRRRRPAKPGDR